MATTRSTDERMNGAQKAAMAVGAVFTLIGLLGWLVTGFDDFAGRAHETLLGFELNPLHNIVHLVIGIAGLVLARRADWARTYGWMLFVGYGVTFFYGLAVSSREEGNLLSLNAADNVLHVVTALAGLAIAVSGSRRRSTTTDRRTESRATVR
jgi:uncharacterized membrane protein YuzA (DUF378 family)